MCRNKSALHHKLASLLACDHVLQSLWYVVKAFLRSSVDKVPFSNWRLSVPFSGYGMGRNRFKIYFSHNLSYPFILQVKKLRAREIK